MALVGNGFLNKYYINFQYVSMRRHLQTYKRCWADEQRKDQVIKFSTIVDNEQRDKNTAAKSI